jgi:hypothetical protein
MTRLSLLALLVIPALAIEPAGMTLDKIKRV